MSNDSRSDQSTWTILKLLKWTTEYLGRHGIDQARSDAEILLAHTLGCQRIDLYLRYDQPLVAAELSRFKAFLKRRVARCPVAYIVGEKEFWSLSLSVSQDVLIPRPETECLVETVLKDGNDLAAQLILDLGTGTGAIPIALATERPSWKFWAIDISEPALTIARQNASRHQVDHQIEFSQGHWFDPLAVENLQFDWVLSNPPYIARPDLAALEPEVRAYEPLLALDGGIKGLDYIDHIIRTAPDYLAAEGQLVLEIGCDQTEAAEEIGRACGAYDRIETFRDYSGLDRVVKFSL